MKGVGVESAGASWEVFDGLPVPEPSENQILVNSIVAPINPVDTYMQATGLLITQFPVVLGCDAGGVVVKTGKKAATHFKEGDRVSGCTRLGVPGYSTFQEYFLMDANLTLPIAKNLSIEQGSTLGVSTYTACLGLISGFKLDISSSAPKDEWIIILGGAGAVGQAAVQIAKALGYKVVTSASSRNKGLVKGLGADAAVDYKQEQAKQLEEVNLITGGNFKGVFDTAAQNEAFARKALDTISTHKTKIFSTTDDWTPMQDQPGVTTYRVQLGSLGRSGAELNGAPSPDAEIGSFVPFLHKLATDGKLKPMEVELVSGGLVKIPEAIQMQQKGSGGKKIVVKIADP